MKYYILSDSIDYKEVGDFPQVQELLDIHSDGVPVGYSALRGAAFSPKKAGVGFPVFCLAAKAKRTDFLSCINVRFSRIVVNQRLLDILKQFNLPKFETHEAFFRKKRGTVSYPYNFVFFLQSMDDYINYEKSHWDKRMRRELVEGNVKFDSFSDYTNKNKTKYFKEFFRPKKIVLPQDIPYDWILLGTASRVNIISERLAEELQKQKITGAKIQAIEEYEKTEFCFE